MTRTPFALLPLLLAACAPAITPVPPEAAIAPPPAWRTDAGPGAPVAPGWWRQFGDPVLSDLVEQALARNADVAIAAARVREARAQEALARSALLPSLDLGVGVVEQRTVNPLGQPATALVVQPVFQASYEVDLFGRVGDQVDAARQGALASEAARETTALAVAAATASGLITLRGLDARLAILQQTLDARTEALRIARNRAEVGYTSDLEFRQAQAEYEATAQQVPQAQLVITRQENALSVLAGELPGPIARGLPLNRLEVPPPPAIMPSDLLRRRPDIAQAEFTLAASDATLSAARAQFLPSLRLSASAGVLASSALGDPIGIWSLGGSVLAPLFNAGRNQAQFDAATARRDQAAFAYRRTVLVAFREVEDGLATAQRLAEQQDALERQRAALASSLQHAINRYQAGYTSYIEQLDAQRALLAADLALVQARTDALNARVALFQAAGGGWQAAS